MLSLLGKSIVETRADGSPISGTEGMDRLQTASMISQIPLSRMGDKSESYDYDYADKVADIGHAAAFLFSPAAYWITGQVMVNHPP
jgi:hypothetical protein